MAKDGGTPWPVWAAVTVLVAVIGTFGQLLVDRPSSSRVDDEAAGVNLSDRLQPPVQSQSAIVPTATAPEVDWTPRLGLYSGESINRLSYNRGVTHLDLKSIEPSGKLRGSIEWSQGLSGGGTIVGTTSGSSADLSGTIVSDETGVWDCDVRLTFTGASAIQGTYRLYPRPGNPHGTQDGEFTLNRLQ